MDAWKFEIIFRVQQDISLVRFANSWDTVSWSILEINFIFPHIHVLFSIYYLLLFIIIIYLLLLLLIIIIIAKKLSTWQDLTFWRCNFYQNLVYINVHIFITNLNFHWLLQVLLNPFPPRGSPLTSKIV